MSGTDAPEKSDGLDRRSFLTSGAVVGAVAALPAQAAAADGIAWDREADVVVIGAGAGGLVAAIAAREKGASVIIVEKNFDIGGRAMMSYGGLYIGGGNRLQQAKGVKDTPDLAFADCLRLMHRHGIRHLPVVANKKAVAVVSIRDLLSEAVKHHEQIKIGRASCRERV